MEQRTNLYMALQHKQADEEFSTLDAAQLDGTLTMKLSKYTIFQLECIETLIYCDDIIGNRVQLLEAVRSALAHRTEELKKYQSDSDVQFLHVGSRSLSSIGELDKYLEQTACEFETNIDIFEYAHEKGCLEELVSEVTDAQLEIVEDKIVRNDIVGVRETIFSAVRREKLNRTSKKVDLKHPKRK